MNRPQTVILALLPVVLVLLSVTHVEALPSFARKYGFSCTVCHVRVPRLNSFGQQFQENGYQLPGTEDGAVMRRCNWVAPRWMR